MKSQDPTASKMLLGCRSKLRTVERVGFLMCLLTHQSFSDSKYQTKMSHALLPMANLFSLDESGCMVNSQDHQGWLPDAILLTPDVGVAVGPASDDAVTLGSPVDTCK